MILCKDLQEALTDDDTSDIDGTDLIIKLDHVYHSLPGEVL
jgi:hypothetical protein